MEAFMYRFHPQWRRAWEIVASGEVGRLRSIQCWFTYDNEDPANIRNRMETGGGALYDIGCYAISSARFLASANAFLVHDQAHCPGEPSRGLYIAERDANFGTDVLGTGILCFGRDGPRSSFHLATKAFPVQRVEALGEGGSLTVILPFNAYPDTALELEVSTGLGTRKIVEGPADQYALMFEAFDSAIRAKAPAPTPIEDALANMAVIEALFRSEKSGAWEKI